MKYLIIYFLNYLDFLVQKKNLIVIKKYSGNKLNTYVDIGAHKGEMIDVIKNNFTVENIFAFEPNPDCLKILSKKKIKKLKIFNYALSNKEGFDYFKIGHISSMSTINSINKNSHYTKIKEKIIRVFFFKKNIYKKKIIIKKKKFLQIFDNNRFKKIDLVKIDTEGHEYNVLLGMGNFIKKINLILLECHYDDSLIKNYDQTKLNRFFKKKNFKLVSKNKMLLRKGYELIYKNSDIIS